MHLETTGKAEVCVYKGSETKRKRSEKKKERKKERKTAAASASRFPLFFPLVYFSRLVAPPAPILASGTSDHLLDGIGLAGAAWRVSSLADVEKTLNAATAIPATTSAVPRRQCLGSAYQPPAGDQTPLG